MPRVAGSSTATIGNDQSAAAKPAGRLHSAAMRVACNMADLHLSQDDQYIKKMMLPLKPIFGYTIGTRKKCVP